MYPQVYPTPKENYLWITNTALKQQLLCIHTKRKGRVCALFLKLSLSMGAVDGDAFF